MDKNFKPVYIRGTETGKGVIEALEILGGKNNCGYKGKPDNVIYYILPSGYIGAATIDSTQGSYIMATAEELKPARWRAEENGTYFMISASLFVLETTDSRDSIDHDLYKSGNYFKTKEEAKKVLEKIKPYFKH